MKKIITIIALITLFVSVSKAQEIRFALKGGLNLGLMSKKALMEGKEKTYVFEAKPTWYAGGRVEYGLSQRSSIQSELLIQKYKGVDEDGQFKTTFEFTDLTLPLVYKFYIIPQKLSINAGFSVGYSLKVYEEYEAKYGTDRITTYTNDKNDDGEPYVKPWNFGFNGGIEYRIIDNVFVDIRYNYGLGNYFNPDYHGEEYDYDDQLNIGLIQIGGGWRF